MRLSSLALFAAGAATAVAVMSAVRMGEPTVTAQAPTAGSMRRAWDGKPNLTGLWQSISTAYRNLEDHGPEPSPFFQLGAIGATPMGQGVVEGGEIPYQAAAVEKKRENFRNRWSRDPELRCYLPGIPRAMYMPYPFQVIQGNNEILMAFPFAGADRVVHMAKAVKPVVDSWMGTSNGRWDGDTLVIEVNGFNDTSWFDRAGNFHSEQLRVTERLTPVAPDALRYEATLEDAKVFTRPWSIRLNLYRLLEENAQLQEFKCVPYAEELVYGYLRKYPAR